jgi:regulator of protease activity HflC (stomatin/prohibitin superfamily)
MQDLDPALARAIVGLAVASDGSANEVVAIAQRAQTTLRSEVGKIELDKTFEPRDGIDRPVVSVLERTRPAQAGAARA